MTAVSPRWESWNPVTGCTQVSEGCRHCYAERFAERWRGVPGHHYEHGFELRCGRNGSSCRCTGGAEPRLRRLDGRPLPWALPDAYVAGSSPSWRVPRHVFHVLTKRPERASGAGALLPWPANIWLGVTVESAAYAARADALRAVPAASATSPRSRCSGRSTTGPHEHRFVIAGGEWASSAAAAGGVGTRAARPLRRHRCRVRLQRLGRPRPARAGAACSMAVSGRSDRRCLSSPGRRQAPRPTRLRVRPPYGMCPDAQSGYEEPERRAASAAGVGLKNSLGGVFSRSGLAGLRLRDGR